MLLLIFLPLNFKEYFFNYFNLREKVADFSVRSSRRFSSAVGAYWKHCQQLRISAHHTSHFNLMQHNKTILFYVLLDIFSFLRNETTVNLY